MFVLLKFEIPNLYRGNYVNILQVELLISIKYSNSLVSFKVQADRVWLKSKYYIIQIVSEWDLYENKHDILFRNLYVVY